MHDTYYAALIRARDALTDLEETLAGVPDAALDWTPVSGTNSLAVLTRHSITATAWLGAQASGIGSDREAYLKNERAASFRARGTTTAALHEELTKFSDELGLLLARGNEATLAAEASWPMADGRNWKGAEFLIHAIAHLREHVGQAQLLRDLWLANSREGR